MKLHIYRVEGEPETPPNLHVICVYTEPHSYGLVLQFLAQPCACCRNEVGVV